MDEERSRQYSVAEVFDSIQGEGFFTGVRMLFLRLAGCSVGRPIDGQPVYEQCETVLGSKFTCDTDFKLKRKMSAEEILSLKDVYVTHVCITGGEPLNQLLFPLINLARDCGAMVHIETSGTVAPEWLRLARERHRKKLWLTVSPKKGCLDSMINIADEIKLLVDEKFNLADVPKSILNHPLVFLQPVNHIDKIDEANLHLAVSTIMLAKPDWRLSTQSHKIWNVK